MKHRAVLILVSICSLLLLGGCGKSVAKLDEAVFHEGPLYKLKLVHFYEKVPFHYTGDAYRVMCQSNATASLKENDMQEAGWRTLGHHPDNQGRTADQLVEEVAKDYQHVNEHMLLWYSRVLNASWNACGTFNSWNPTQLPQFMINKLEKPDTCQPQGSGDCRYYDFEGDRQPVYEMIEMTKAGKFVGKVSTAALSPSPLVFYTDFKGVVWHVEPYSEVYGGNGDRDFIAATQNAPVMDISGENVSAQFFGKRSARQVTLKDWINKLFIARTGAMVVWSNKPVECSAKDLNKQDSSDTAQCAEIFITNRWGHEAQISLVHEDGKFRWNNASLSVDGESKPIAKLSDLPTAMEHKES